jgi:hypothetical protein
MGRRWRYLLRLFATGLALAVVVSWSLAAWGGLTTAEVNRPPFDSAYPPMGVDPPAGWDIRTWVPRRGPGLRHDAVTEMEWIGSTFGAMEGRGNRYMERAASGWPVPCLQWASDDTTDPGPILRGLPVPLPHRSWPERRLPLRPLWAPLLIDVLTWTGAVAAARMWFASARATFRARRGLCAACGYPHGPGSLCPECGRPADSTVEPSAGAAGAPAGR